MIELNKSIIKEYSALSNINKFINNFINIEYTNGNIYPNIIEIRSEFNLDKMDIYWVNYGFVKLIELLYNSFNCLDIKSFINISHIYMLEFIKMFDDGNGDGYNGKLIYIWCKYYLDDFIKIIKSLHRFIYNHIYINLGDKLFNQLFK